MSDIKAPWLENYGDIPHTLEYFDGTMYQAVKLAKDKYPNFVACDFFGKKTTYKKLVCKIESTARALLASGIKSGDKVTVCLPNCPQTVLMLYAINCIGAVANMVHPLSSENEIAFFLNESQSKAAITLDQFYYKFKSILDSVKLNTLIITSIKDELTLPMRIGYSLTDGRKIKKISKNEPVVFWNHFQKNGKNYIGDVEVKKSCDDAAVILYSGGTTGTTKGILLSNKNFNALGSQIIATNPMFNAGDKMLAVMPMFHGFGLGVSIHSMLINGGRCILVPRFTAKSYAKLIIKYKCNFIAGVPTLFEALIRQTVMEGADLSCLKGVFSGGDSLSVELKKKFDEFLSVHNCKVKIREGYGTTECVTASCLTPIHLAKEGSIGQPFPDTFYKIVKVGTDQSVPFGELGEICISGPTVMIGYMNNPKETANTKRVHKDQKEWIHTGDLGTMDSDGFIYFKQRLKRVIVTSGYNVYPSQLENIIDAHEIVQMSCVIGVPDAYKMQKVKAFVMLKDGVEQSEKNRNILFDYCKKNISKYAMPYEIEFRDSLPKTPVGKVAYRELEQQELDKFNK